MRKEKGVYREENKMRKFTTLLLQEIGMHVGRVGEMIESVLINHSYNSLVIKIVR